MKTKGSLLLLLLLISGCVSVEFVRKDITPVKQAILRYSPPSSEKRAAEYREEVKKEASAFCGGDFNITKEYQALGEGHSSVGVGTGFGIGTGGSSIMFGGSNRNEVMYNFVELTCK